MKIALLLLMALVTGCGCATTPPQASGSVALRLEFDNGLCSGTAIGPDEIITAAHCFADGTLTLVGLGQWREDQVAEALEARDRAALGLNAPAEGLYFVGARYKF